MGKGKASELVEQINDELINFTAAECPVTVRQCYYHLVSKGLLDKTEKEYGWTSRQLVKLRTDGAIPFEHIADNTRWVRKPSTFSGLPDILAAAHRSYRRSIWDDQDEYVEIWLEKDALAGVLEQVTDEYDVPLNVCRGFASFTFLKSAADIIKQVGKPTYIYYFGDYDPAGQEIPKNVERRLFEFGAEIQSFELSAVTRGQITELALPTRPTKRGNGLAKKFEGDSVELDAIPPGDLRRMVEKKILLHLDLDKYKRTLEMQETEKQICLQIASQWDADSEGFMRYLAGGKRK